MDFGMSYYVLEHNRRTGENEIRAFERFADAIPFLNERETRRAPHNEVVLLYADSLDDIRQTHSRYFHSPESLIDVLKQQIVSSAAT